MLVIRFQRVGRKNDPAFRVVVTEKRSKPKGAGIEMLGSYHPKTKATVLENERILYWLSRGAKTSPTVHNLLISKGVIKGAKINVAPLPKKVKENEAAGVAAIVESQPESTPKIEEKKEEGALKTETSA